MTVITILMINRRKVVINKNRAATVCAGHREQNMLRTIRALPREKEKQNPAIPLVTYGGVHSSIANEALNGRGYIPIMNIKIAAKHTLTATFENQLILCKPPNIAYSKKILIIAMTDRCNG